MMRKLFISITLVALLCGWTGCDSWMRSESTPEIHCSYLLKNPYYVLDTMLVEDTLAVEYASSMGCYCLEDTLVVGDRALMNTAFYGVLNELQTVSAIWDSSLIDVTFAISTDMQQYLSPETDVDKCYLRFFPGYNLISFPIYFRAKKAGVPRVSLKVETDSKYSPSAVTIAFPIR